MLMNDVNDPIFLGKLFDYCDTKKIAKKMEIGRLIRDFNYGALHKQNKPSPVNFDRTNLGQNATQLYFIMIHLPFILMKSKDKLKDVWLVLETLLKAIQIIYSQKICEDDINNLDSYIAMHYTPLIEVFDAKLIPKHHHILHYPNAIRKMGPIIFSSMIGFESRHQFFTRAARNTNNFINIAKTLARKNQEAVSYKIFATDVTEISKSSINFNKCQNFVEFSGPIAKFFGSNDLDNLKVLNFVKFNSFEYRPGLIIISNDCVYEIIQVLSNSDQILFFFLLPILRKEILFIFQQYRNCAPIYRCF